MIVSLPNDEPYKKNLIPPESPKVSTIQNREKKRKSEATPQFLIGQTPMRCRHRGQLEGGTLFGAQNDPKRVWESRVFRKVTVK